MMKFVRGNSTLALADSFLDFFSVVCEFVELVWFLSPLMQVQGAHLCVDLLHLHQLPPFQEAIQCCQGK